MSKTVSRHAAPHDIELYEKLAAACEAYARQVRAYKKAVVDRAIAKDFRRADEAARFATRAEAAVRTWHPLIHVIEARIRGLQED